jgi:leucyl aminopeptidase
MLSNYDWNMKSGIEDKPKKENGEEEDVDERTERKTKLVDDLAISHEEPHGSEFSRHSVLA